MVCAMPSIQRQFSVDMLIDSLKLILTGKEPLPPALLIYGEEEFLREEAYHAIMHKVLPEGMHHDIEIIDAENSSESPD